MGTGSGAGNGSGGANGSLGTRNSNELSISGSLPKLYSLRTFAMNKSRLKTLQIPNEFRARFAFRSGNLDRARTPPPVRPANSLHSRHPAPPPATEFRIPLHLLTQAFGTCPTRNCHPGRRNLSHPITSRGISRVLEDKAHSLSPVPEIDQQTKNSHDSTFVSSPGSRLRSIQQIANPHPRNPCRSYGPPKNGLTSRSSPNSTRRKSRWAESLEPKAESPKPNLMFAFYSPCAILRKLELHHSGDTFTAPFRSRTSRAEKN